MGLVDGVGVVVAELVDDFCNLVVVVIGEGGANVRLQSVQECQPVDAVLGGGMAYSRAPVLRLS